ncbi:MAG: DEAD/DEAH box helicase [Candidatus Njordarchaeales archaeon]
MPKVKLFIGDHLLESNELDIKQYIQVNNYLRRFCVSDASKGGLRLDWRIFISPEQLLEKLENTLGVDNSFVTALRRITAKLLKETPNILLENDYIFFAIKEYDYNEVIERIGGELVLKIIEIRDLGKIECPYLRFSREKLPLLVQQFNDPMLPENFRKLLIELRNKMAEQKVVIREFGVKWIEVKIPMMASKEFLEELKSLGVVRYYISDSSTGELVLKEEKMYKEVRSQEGVLLRLPNYAIAMVSKICAKHGYLPDITIKIPDKISEEIDQKFQLMPYQDDALKAWINNNNLGTIVIPTGGGKTFIGLAAISKLKVPTIVFVPNKLLLWQWRDRINKFLGIPKDEIGILGAGEKKIKDITVATYQSGVKYVEKIATRFSLVIFDEGHHVPARTFKDTALYMRAPYRMALSATPQRFDKNEILLFQLAGEIVYKIDYSELVRRGILAPLAVRKILVPLPPELQPLYNALEKEAKNATDEFDRKKKINKLIEVARDNPEKIGVVREIVKKHKDEKIFIFAGSINFAETIASAIRDIIPTAVLTAKISESEEKKIAKDFLEGRIRALVLVKKGEEGLDVGDASVAIIAGGSKQVREFIQRVGRVLRGGPTKLAWVYEIVTKNTIEEAISRARRARELVRGIEDFIKKNYGVRAFRVINWPSKFL